MGPPSHIVVNPMDPVLAPAHLEIVEQVEKDCKFHPVFEEMAHIFFEERFEDPENLPLS